MGHMWCTDGFRGSGSNWASLVRHCTDDSVPLLAPPARPWPFRFCPPLSLLLRQLGVSKRGGCGLRVGRRPTSSPAGGARDSHAFVGSQEAMMLTGYPLLNHNWYTSVPFKIQSFWFQTTVPKLVEILRVIAEPYGCVCGLGRLSRYC
jgi:hypothetical protein